jgi:putative Mn2+ efflux pump MntP
MTGLLNRPERVRRLIGSLTVLGGVALAVFTVLELPLVGVGVYALAVIGAVAIQSRATVPVFDERDEEISRDAAEWTLTLLGLGSASVFPALTVAWGLDLYEWQAWSSAIALFVAVLFLVYAAFLVAFNYRR